MRLGTVVIAFGVALAGCGRHSQERERPVGTALAIRAPLGLPEMHAPGDNPVTLDTIALGRQLFYERRLSANSSQSCASCHQLSRGFGDGQKVSRGVTGAMGKRNAPTILNSAYASAHFWDGRAASLEEQAAGPIANPIEMNQTHEACVENLNKDAVYRAAFERAFGPGPVTIGKVQKALASFERTLLSGNSPFDRYQFGGDASAMSAVAVRGLAIFKDANKGNCAACHTIEQRYALFTDGKFHNIGIGIDSSGELVDPGRFAESKQEAERGAFKTPTLRNVATSAPYMHDGSLATLRDVVDYYVGGGNSNPNLDPKMKPLTLTRADREDLVAFLQSLTGEMPADAGPPGGR